MHAKEYYYLNFLNSNCPIEEEWKYDKPVYHIRVNKDPHDKVADWLEKIIGCSFVYEFDDEEILNLKVSNSTLEPRIENLIRKHNDEDGETVKIDRFELVQGNDTYHDKDYWYIIDKVTLIKDMGRPPRDVPRGAIFVACSSSQWANYTLAWDVMEKLNKEEAYVNMIDYCNRKY